MSQLFLFVMSLVEEIYLLNTSALLSINAAMGQVDSITSLTAAHRWNAQKRIWQSTGMFFKMWWVFWRLLAVCKVDVWALQRRDLHGFYSSCATDKSLLHSAGVRGPWMFLEFLHLLAHLRRPTCSYRFLSKLYSTNNIMLFCKASLSLCYFVQPFLSLLSTITVCNMNLVERNMQYFRHQPLTVLESEALTQNPSEASIHNLK